jgi:signal transduction histidine kinase
LIKSKLFVRFALLGTLISAIMLVVSIFTTQWMRDLIFDEPFRDRGPFRAVERIIENMNPADRVQGLRDLQTRPRSHPPGMPPMNAVPSPFFDFVLLDQNGAVLFPQSVPEPRYKDILSLIERLKASSNEVEALSEQTIIRKLRGTPAQYLARGTRYRPPPPPPKHFALLMSVQLLSILIAVLLTLGAVLLTLRQRAREAEQVIRDLSAGNLKARIPITKMDEIGTVMFSFNKMADEIEHLIEHLRKTEHARRDLLRELAHDLRTPVASLKSLIETVNERAEQLPPEKRRELLDLAMREAEYFEGLVDDLLFLGRVQEPKYKTNAEKFDLREMIRLEIEPIQHRHPKIEVCLDGDEVMFDGDAGLLKRLVRNAIENAVSFAKSRVDVLIRSDGKHVEIEVEDDGPGFDPASLASFGQRKYSRAIVNGPTKRISIGLGSVIMKSIADAYRGELKAANRIDEGTRDIHGASVSIRLPIS